MNKKQPLKVLAGAPDKPLVIKEIDLKIDCYVLEGEIRVLSQRGLQESIGMSPGGSRIGARKIVDFVGYLAKKGIDIKDLTARANNPLEFQPPWGGRTAFGYKADILTDLCNVVLSARDAGVLLKQQEHIAQRCQALLNALPKIAMEALVDEVTGYQEFRARDYLQKILAKYLSKELSEWTKTFPDEFYHQIYRLKGWSGPDGVKRPSVIGRYTNDIVYERLAPGVLDALQSRNPVLAEGYRKDRHHQLLSEDFGQPKLREHLIGVLALMRAAPNWNRFKGDLARSYPRLNEQIPLALDD